MSDVPVLRLTAPISYVCGDAVMLVADIRDANYHLLGRARAMLGTQAARDLSVALRQGARKVELR